MRLIKQYPLASFFVLAFLITWTFQLTAIALASRYGMTLNNETGLLHFMDLLSLRLSLEQALVYGVFTLGAGPLISAILVTRIVDGRTGLRALWQQSTHWRIGVRWYLIAFALPLALALVSLGIGLLASNGQITYTPKLPLIYFVPFFLYMLIFTGIVEEPGWRGFALPRLQRRYTAEKASWILGPLWGLWHFPFIIYYNAGQGIAPLIFSFIGLTIGIVGWTIVNTWLYNNTHSVWIMIVLHGWNNAVQSYLILSSNNPAAIGLYSILPWAIAFVLLRLYGKENLAPHPRPQGYNLPESSPAPEPFLSMVDERI
ncbi:MAG TPA: CPBP family intramembrane glutamic endopeptidase [Herpetosiphonaceae bacterium]